MSYSQYCRLNVSVGATGREVIKRASQKIKKKSRFNRDQRMARHAFYRAMLAQHNKAKKLCERFRF
ncbi:MAG: hypothetical protein ACKO0Z_13540 [Betaproteobacteria bacterium]